MTQIKNIKIQDFALWDKMNKHHRPFSFNLEITPRCNNDCSHCYINLSVADQDARSKELTLLEIDTIADQAIALGAIWVLITGGEPLIRDDFQDIYLLLKRKGLLVSVFTNATLIREEHVELFQKYPPRDIEITVYGATQESYERVTGRIGSFASFSNGLNRLIEANIKVRLKAIAMRSNYLELPAIAAFCRAHTKDYFRFDPQLHLRLDHNEKRNLMIKSERLTPEEIVALEKADEERFSILQKGCSVLIIEEFAQNDGDLLFRCGLGKGSFDISYDGKFRLCSSLCAPETVYDLRAGSLREAWEEFVPKVCNMRSNRPEYLDHCRICPIVNLCLWCPAHAYLETGDLDTSIEYFCQVARARAAAIQEDNSAG